MRDDKPLLLIDSQVIVQMDEKTCVKGTDVSLCRRRRTYSGFESLIQEHCEAHIYPSTHSHDVLLI